MATRTRARGKGNTIAARLLTADEVAERLGCDRDTIISEAKRGELECVLVGARPLYRFRLSAVAAYLARRRTGAALHADALGLTLR